jgi:hypothetical protein
MLPWGGADDKETYPFLIDIPASYLHGGLGGKPLRVRTVWDVMLVDFFVSRNIAFEYEPPVEFVLRDYRRHVWRPAFRVGNLYIETVYIKIEGKLHTNTLARLAVSQGINILALRPVNVAVLGVAQPTYFKWKGGSPRQTYARQLTSVVAKELVAPRGYHVLTCKVCGVHWVQNAGVFTGREIICPFCDKSFFVLPERGD